MRWSRVLSTDVYSFNLKPDWSTDTDSASISFQQCGLGGRFFGVLNDERVIGRQGRTLRKRLVHISPLFQALLHIFCTCPARTLVHPNSETVWRILLLSANFVR